MSGEKTEKPTAKKLRDARKKGQVPKSKEVSSAAILMGMFGLIWVFGKLTFQQFQILMELPIRIMRDPRGDTLHFAMETFAYSVAILSIPIAVVIIVVAIAANMGQFGFLLSFESITPKFSKLNPAEGAKKIFKKENLFEFLKNVIKILGLGILMFFVVRGAIQDVILLPQLNFAAVLTISVTLLKQFVLLTIAFSLTIAVVDYFYQQYQFTENQKMSKDEVKREHKEANGDPQLKGKRKQLHQEMSANNQMQAVRNASVLVTNPTHRAVAIYYEEEVGGLPMVIGKGTDHLALQMIKIAEEEGVPIMQNVPLAWALYDDTEVEKFIPSELIKPVAEVLRWVKQQKEAEQT